jgi:hypothetical protein
MRRLGFAALCLLSASCALIAGIEDIHLVSSSETGSDASVEAGDHDATDARVDCQGDDCTPPRLLAPLSTAITSSRHPRLMLAARAAGQGDTVDLCADRACQNVLETIRVPAGEGSVVPAKDLPPGAIFWRATHGAAPSRVWEFFVGRRSAPIDTSWGSVLDVNGDGHADLAGGAPFASSSEGRAFVFLSGSKEPPAELPSSTLACPTTGCIWLGISLASAGDVNGDGYGDLIVGAMFSYAAEPIDGGVGVGRAYVYYGGPDGLTSAAPTALSARAGVAGFGVSVSTAGDVNRDGYADVIVGGYSAGGSGRAYLFTGGPNGIATTPAVTLSGPNDAKAAFGVNVAGVGDINGDGFADVAVSASNLGKVYFFYGTADGIPASSSAAVADPGDPSSGFGTGLAGGGDVNGDGYPDLLVGAARAAGETGRGYVFHGGPGGPAASPASTLIPSEIGGEAGRSLSFLRDVDGDGYDDVLLGSWTEKAASTGRAYVFHGGNAGLGSTPAPVVTLMGPGAPGSQFGAAVSGTGDVNGDGFADALIGAPCTRDFDGGPCDGNAPGRMLLFFGGAPAPADAGVSLTLSRTPAASFGVAASGHLGIAVSTGP